MAVTKSSKRQLRLRIFAGPNGSGKSTIIRAVKETKIEGRPIDFGDYINADDITRALMDGSFSFSRFRAKVTEERLTDFAEQSGLLAEEFTKHMFVKAFNIKNKTRVILSEPMLAERMGQMIARFLREEMLRLRRRFSFETVFSHESNLDIMRQAAEAGYKIYLYFVATESFEINKYRVALRVADDGHDVPPHKIIQRYSRSLKLMYRASQLAYQAFFFDNSKENQPFELVAHFKRSGKKKVWDKIPKNKVSKWFVKYNKPTPNQ